MKENRIFYIVLLLSTIYLGCAKDITTSNTSFSKIVESSSQNESYDELGVYEGRFRLFDGNLNIYSTTKAQELTGTSYSGRITAWYFDDVLANPRNIIDGGDLYINDLRMEYNGSNYQSNQLMRNDQIDYNLVNNFINNEVFGKMVRIKNETGNEVRFDEQFYVPEQIHLTGDLENQIEGTTLSRMNRNNFTIGYNYDAKNENGLLIHLVFSGEFYGMSLDDLQNLPSTNNLDRFVHLKQEHLGEITIPAALFEGIPSEGIVTMYVGRGNAKVVEKDEKKYHLHTHTTQQFRVVLD